MTSTKKSHPTTTGRVHNVPVDQSNWREQLQTRRIKFDDEKKLGYLVALAEHGRKTDAQKAVGISGRCVNQHLENDPDFALGYQEAIASYRDRLVSHHQNLLFNGEITQRFDRNSGKLVEETVKYPIQLILAELKKVDPEYRDKQSIDLNHNNGGVLVVPFEQDMESWLEEIDEENEQLEPPSPIYTEED